jgi:hypothetical protein
MLITSETETSSKMIGFWILWARQSKSLTLELMRRARWARHFSVEPEPMASHVGNGKVGNQKSKPAPVDSDFDYST